MVQNYLDAKTRAQEMIDTTGAFLRWSIGDAEYHNLWNAAEGRVQYSRLDTTAVRDSFKEDFVHGVNSLGLVDYAKKHLNSQANWNDQQEASAFLALFGCVPAQVEAMVDGLKGNFNYDTFMKQMNDNTMLPNVLEARKAVPLSQLNGRANNVAAWANTELGLAPAHQIDPTKLDSIVKMAQVIEQVVPYKSFLDQYR